MEGKSVQIPDVLSDPEYAFGEFARLGDFRWMVPECALSKGQFQLAYLSCTAQPCGRSLRSRSTWSRPSLTKRSSLWKTTRLLNELRQRTTDLTERTADLTEALEQQGATSEVLKVISSSPGDRQPVFATMFEKAVTICEAKFGDIYRWDGDALHLMANHKIPPA